MSLAPLSTNDVSNVVGFVGDALTAFARKRRALFVNEIQPAFTALEAVHRDLIAALARVEFCAAKHLATEREYIRFATEEFRRVRIAEELYQTVAQARIPGQPTRAIVFPQAEELRTHLNTLLNVSRPSAVVRAFLSLEKSQWTRRMEAAHAFATVYTNYFKVNDAYRHDLGSLETQLCEYTKNHDARPTAIPPMLEARLAQANAPLLRFRKSYDIARYVQTACQNGRKDRNASWSRVAVQYAVVQRMFK